MEAIKLIRLKTGEDIIAYLEQVDKLNFIVREPMAVLIKHDYKANRQIIMMEHWLPTQVILHNEAFITESDILTILEPTVDFIEHFENSIEDVAKTKEMNCSLEQDESEPTLTADQMLMLLELVGPETTELIH